MAGLTPLERLRRERDLGSASRARARVAGLVDDGSFLELGGLARSQHPKQADRTPADGLVAGWATIGGREVGIFAEDADVLAHTDGEVARTKRSRILQTCAVRRNPVVFLADGAGTEATFAPGTGDLYGYAAPQRPEPRAEELAAPTVTVALGRCAGRSLELLARSDLVLATPAGPVELADGVIGDEAAALSAVRQLIGPQPSLPPAQPLTDDLLPGMMVTDVLQGLFDAGSVLILRSTEGFATGVGRLEGELTVFAATGGQEPHRLITGDLRATRRAARLARRLRAPLVFVQDSEGYDPAVSNSPVFVDELAGLQDEVRGSWGPKLVLVTGRGHVLGGFALGGRQLGIDYVAALPFARVAAADSPSYDAGRLPSVEDPWLAAGLGVVDDVLAPGEVREHLVRTVRLLLHGRSFPPPDVDRQGRLIDDISKV